MILIGYQYMLCGLADGEIVVEVEVSVAECELIPDLSNIDETMARRLIATTPFQTTERPETWYIDRQALYQR
jgi:hypothetical protein